MKADSLIPKSLFVAKERIRKVSAMAPESLNRDEFLKAWFAVAYVYPGFHPDNLDSPDCSLPKQFLPLSKDAWRRNEAGELTDEMIYPSDAAWAGICDRFESFTAVEATRRRKIHREYPIPTEL